MSEKNNDQYILNPKTNRMIKIGSRVYNKLITEGILKLDDKLKRDDNILFKLEDIFDEENKEEIFKNKKDELKNEYKQHEIVEMDNKLIKRNKKLNRTDFVDQLSNFIYKIINEEQEFIDYLKGLTLDELKKDINESVINEL